MTEQANFISVRFKNLSPLPASFLFKSTGLFLGAFALLTMIPALFFDRSLLIIFYACAIASVVLIAAWLLCGKRLCAHKRISS